MLTLKKQMPKTPNKYIQMLTLGNIKKSPLKYPNAKKKM